VGSVACSTNCPTQDHESYGACLRGKNIQIDRLSLQVNVTGGRSAQAQEVSKNASLDRYRQMRESGLHPLSPLKRDLDATERSLSDKPKKVSNA
jgi:hypothetical protein